jgi:hypothetical protein
MRRLTLMVAAEAGGCGGVRWISSIYFGVNPSKHRLDGFPGENPVSWSGGEYLNTTKHTQLFTRHQRYSTTYMSASTPNNLHSSIQIPRTAHNHPQVTNHKPSTPFDHLHTTIHHSLPIMPPARTLPSIIQSHRPYFSLLSLFFTLLSSHPSYSLFLPSNLPWKSTLYILIPKITHSINMSTNQAVHNLFNILYTYPQKMLSTVEIVIARWT